MIKPIENLSQTIQSTSVTRTDSSNADLFKQILGKAVKENTESVTGTKSTDGSESSASLSELTSIRDISYIDGSTEFETRAEELINKLSQYSYQLDTQGVSLKDVSSLINDINSNAESIVKDAEESGDTDQELMSIIRECAITAHSEYIKFQRGDYLESEVA